MFNFVPNYKETPHYSDDKLGITQYVQFCAQL